MRARIPDSLQPQTVGSHVGVVLMRADPARVVVCLRPSEYGKNYSAQVFPSPPQLVPPSLTFRPGSRTALQMHALECPR